MAFHRIKDTVKQFHTEVFEVEADSPQKALELYINELAGSMNPVDEYVDDNATKEDITLE